MNIENLPSLPKKSLQKQERFLILKLRQKYAEPSLKGVQVSLKGRPIDGQTLKVPNSKQRTNQCDDFSRTN